MNKVDTDIKLVVETVREIEAPLGGTSVEYVITGTFKQSLFNSNCEDNGIVHVEISKSYREFEDLYAKMKKKYTSLCLPVLPKSKLEDHNVVEEKRKHLDNFVKGVAQNKNISLSPILLQFLGVDRDNLQKSSVCKGNSKINNQYTEDKKETTREKTVIVDDDGFDIFEELQGEQHPTFSKMSDIKKKKEGLFDDTEVTEPELFGYTKSKSAYSRKTLEYQPTVESKSPAGESAEESKSATSSLPGEENTDEWLFTVPNTHSDFLFTSDDIDPKKEEENEEEMTELLKVDTNLDDLFGKKMSPPKTDIETTQSQAAVSSTVTFDVATASETDSVSTFNVVKPVPKPRAKNISTCKNSTSHHDPVSSNNEETKKQLQEETFKKCKPTPPPKPVSVTSVKPVPLPKPKILQKPVAGNQSTHFLGASKMSHPSAEIKQTQTLDKEVNKLPVESEKTEDIDIVKYIEEEQKSTQSTVSLFD
ncbi:DNA ligase 1-like [Limulus polyphemus]|uniref:DNA ligase 1-like n=1 Tax=Limulus polyphemus TaxID=6850 RepID=A0ABM1B1W4_LIMPO|nr:DNA ligase 1-like [Limulus polyphemus]